MWTVSEGPCTGWSRSSLSPNRITGYYRGYDWRGKAWILPKMIWITFLSAYVPQSGLSDEVKDLFFDQLHAVTARIPASEFLIPCGDWNGHVGYAGTGYREVHCGIGYGRAEPDVEGERILTYALAFNLLLGNTCFKKCDSHLITYKSGNIAT